jgi:RNA polymerase sigma-70 factor (ECF subfamily)
MLTQSSEQVLIANASNGDLDSFNQLVLNYQHILYRHAYALVNDPDAADDITQDSFIKAFQNIHGFRSSFRWPRHRDELPRDRWRRMGKHPTVSLFVRGDQGRNESPN